VTGEDKGLKVRGKRVTLALALLVGAIIAGVAIRGQQGPPPPLEISADESLLPQEILLREIIGAPAGAPEGFECLQVYEVRPLDTAASFARPFTINFTRGGDDSGLEVARLEDGTWVEVKHSRPWFSDVTARVRTEKPGIYALGRRR